MFGHRRFGMDHVAGRGKQEALDKFNALAKTRLKYPHMWNEAKLRDVTRPDIIK